MSNFSTLLNFALVLWGVTMLTLVYYLHRIVVKLIEISSTLKQIKITLVYSRRVDPEQLGNQREQPVL